MRVSFAHSQYEAYIGTLHVAGLPFFISFWKLFVEIDKIIGGIAFCVMYSSNIVLLHVVSVE